MGSDRVSKNAFELRLEGGASFGFGPPRPGDAGMAQILHAPDFCRNPGLAHYFNEGAKAQWSLSPIDTAARKTFTDAASHVRSLDINAITHGIAFIEVSGGYRCVFVEVCLPTTDIRNTGVSSFEDWLRILRAAKDDLNQEALLQLNFAADQLQEADIAGFKIGKRLATTDVQLQVRPRLIQWARDD